ncbi:tRNA1(Val) (adenine(37)-N6)-methyltransferase [Pedobacter aquatilis]|uniref:tRNA1(Val) (adenine(37)-N6)-methyltransferase n=1 Tax=Pedobacter aquatilis TaxID=351343 RepID=UPI00292E8506|nr:methyltransferase [Pedobacter aquatilis]
MAGDMIFKFKQFAVDQAGCAMKINTDGVLLAASVSAPVSKYVLDIGTGTGVIALMLAQRFPEALIDAVEIDLQAAETASRNARNSVYDERICVHHSSFQDFDTHRQYDLIVSNPPFFVKDLKNEEQRKGIARHADEDFFEMLLRKSATLLSEEGRLWLVLPLKQAEVVAQTGAGMGLFVVEKVYMHSDESKPPFRMMICLTKSSRECLENHLYIYVAEKVHTQAYKDLLKDFFLHY